MGSTLQRREMEGTVMTTREQRTPEMYPDMTSMQPILVGRHQDFMEEARQNRLRQQARAGQPHRSWPRAIRQRVGFALVGFGQRLAGSHGETVERLPAKPALRGLR